MKESENPKEQLKSVLEEIKNVSTPIPKNADVFERLHTFSSNVIRASLQDWQDAYEFAKEVDCPDRMQLLEIYETIEIDTHITAITETIFHGISSMDFQVLNSNNENDEELKKLFKTSWFKDWLSIAVESIFWGFSGIQYGAVKDDKFTSIKSISRYNIRPMQNGIALQQTDEKADISFSDEPYKTWTTLIFPRMFGDQYQLGKYNKVAKWFILKREVTQFWAIFNELFGHPYRVTKTNIKDNVRRQNAINAMEAMTTASFAVVDLEDEVEFISASGTGSGYKTFSDFIEVADKQMSKGIIGSTMVVDEGSSRSQGETHLKNTNSFIVGYAEMIENLINDELIPKMAKLGFQITVEDRFNYEQIEKVSKLQWSEIISKLSPLFDIDPDTINELIGIKVEEKIIQLPTVTKEDVENRTFIDKIMNFYKSKH
ncbi:MAG: DUF935 family protein [Nitrosopumilus sp.]